MNTIYRKFLLSQDIERWLSTQSYTKEKTEQFYVQTTDDTECYYYKIFPKTYTKYIIDEEGNTVNISINKDEYKQHRKKCLGQKIVCKSYTVKIEGQVFIVTKYLKKRKGLYTLTVSSVDGRGITESSTFNALQSLVLKDIRNDKKYSTYSLATCGEIMEYNLPKLFDKIDAFEPANLFFWQVPKRLYVRDGVALVLYKNLRLLHHYKINYQQKHFAASLHRLRVLMRRSATLLEAFSEYFDPNIHRFCSSLLLRYHEQSKVLRYLYFLDELCDLKEEASEELEEEIKDLIFVEHRNISQMLHNQQFIQLVAILTREVQEPNMPQCLALEDEVINIVQKRLEELEHLIAQTKEGYDEGLLEAIHMSIDSLQTLIEDFFHIIGEKKTNILVEELNILLKPLRDYRNCTERKIILKALQEQATKEIDISPLLCNHEKELEEKIDTALKLLRASKFYV